MYTFKSNNSSLFCEKKDTMDIAHRFKENPLLIPDNLTEKIEGMEISCLLNPGVFEWNGKIGLLLRVAERPKQKDGVISFPIYDDCGKIKVVTFDKNDKDLDCSDPRVIKYKGKCFLTTLSYLRFVFSDDKIHFFEDEKFAPIFGQGMLESFGIEDCRVTKIDQTFFLTYTEVSSVAVGVGLITTDDWKTYKRHGMIFPPHNKDCTLFDERINGIYYALHRPSSPELGGNYIWLAESLDGIHWGNHKCLVTTREGYWDEARIGAGASPIKTSKGWLVIYHGATYGHRYCLGALLLDLEDPSIVLARSEEPIMEPIMPYEQNGFFGNVIFSNGHCVSGDIITLYYGASDEVICGATLSINEIIDTLSF